MSHRVRSGHPQSHGDLTSTEGRGRSSPCCSSGHSSKVGQISFTNLELRSRLGSLCQEPSVTFSIDFKVHVKHQPSLLDHSQRIRVLLLTQKIGSSFAIPGSAMVKHHQISSSTTNSRGSARCQVSSVIVCTCEWLTVISSTQREAQHPVCTTCTQMRSGIHLKERRSLLNQFRELTSIV